MHAVNFNGSRLGGKCSLYFVLGALLPAFLAVPLAAQKANFELAEKFTTEKMKKTSSSLTVDANWLKNQSQFWYTYKTPSGKNWYMVDAAKRSKKMLFDQEDMAAQLAETFKKPFNSKDLPLKDFKYDEGKKLFTFHVDSIQFTYRVGGRRLVKGDSLTKKPDESWITYSPDSTWIAFNLVFVSFSGSVRASSML